jgi:hypothetical protein
MVDYVKLQDTAQKLISKFGLSCTFTKVTEATYNPSTYAQTKTTTDYTLKGVKLDQKSSNFDKEIIKTGDIFFLLEAKNLSVVPDADDKVAIGSVSWSIIAVHPIEPGSTTVYYEMILRK